MFLTGVVLFFVLCSLANEHPFLFSFFFFIMSLFGKSLFHPGTCISSLYHADSFFSLDMCHADRPKARMCFLSVKAFSCTFASSRWYFEVKVRGCAVLLRARTWAATPGWKSDCSGFGSTKRFAWLNERKRGMDSENAWMKPTWA